MRRKLQIWRWTVMMALLPICWPLVAQDGSPTAGHTLTVYVEGVNKAGGNIGILLFNGERGWPEINSAAFRKMEVPAHAGTVVFKIDDLPAGTYALSLAHDVNCNRKLDRNWFGKPTEQWGLSNNPHAYLKAPPFSKSQFSFTQNSEIHIRMQ